MATPFKLPTPQPCPWVCDTNRSPPAYTRPLVGSERFVDLYSSITQGGADVCHGVNFSSPLDAQELQRRARSAFGRLRYFCPLIAASVEDTPDGTGKSERSWVYTPVQDESKRELWLQKAFVFEDKGAPIDTDAFIKARNLMALPYDIDGQKVDFRCYLLAGSPGTYALYFHGPHSAMDGWPTLHAFSLMFEWMSADSALEKLEWGTEWKNLPPDPVTATGGPRPTWDTDGLKLFGEVAAVKTREVPCLTVGSPLPQPENKDQIRVRHVFDQSVTQALISAAKTHGGSVTLLLEAAHCLALAACNPVDLNAVPEVDFSAEMTVSSLEREFVESINTRTHFITAFSHIPARIPMAEILKVDSAKERLVLTMKALKDQFDHYKSNPCLPHLLAALARIPGSPRGPYFNTLATNLGIVEARLQKKWRGPGEITVFEIDEMCVGHRMRTSMISIHSWSFNGCINIQVQANDMWKDASGGSTKMQTFLDEMARQAQVILN